MADLADKFLPQENLLIKHFFEDDPYKNSKYDPEVLKE